METIRTQAADANGFAILTTADLEDHLFDEQYETANHINSYHVTDSQFKRLQQDNRFNVETDF